MAAVEPTVSSPLSHLATVFGVTPTRAELTYVLFKLDREFKGEGWEDHYATVLVRHFTAG